MDISDHVNTREIAAAVIFYMPGWRLLPYDPERENSSDRDRYCDIERTADKRVLHVSAQWREKKITISGQFRHNYTPHMLYGTSDPDKPITSIGVNPAKAAEKIAADIFARLLPGCETAWSRSDERWSRDELDKRDARALVRQLAGLLHVVDPTLADPDHRHRGTYSDTRERWALYDRGTYDNRPPVSVTAEFESGYDTVTFKLEARVADAPAIAKFLGQMNAAHAKTASKKARTHRRAS